MERGACIVQNALIGLLGSMGGDSLEGDGGREADGVLGPVGIGAVVAAFVYLVVHAVGPVVVGHAAVFGVDVAIDVVFAPHVPHDVPLVGRRGVVLGVFRGAYVDGGDALLDGGAAFVGSGPWLVVVVDDVDLHALAAIAAIACPVVEDVVAQVHLFAGLRAGAGAKTGHARVVMGHEVMMIGSTCASPVAAIAVVAFAVA